MNNFISEESPYWNVRCGDTTLPVTWTASPITGIPAQGVVAVGGNAAGGDTGEFKGAFSVHVGYMSGGLTDGGYCQVAVGLRTLQNSTATYSTAIGTDALMAHVSGNEQVAIGAKALLADVDGYSSTVVGTAAAYTAAKAVKQVVIGTSAARLSALGDADQGNVIIGYNAAYNRPGGAYNVEIGHDAGNIARRVDYCTHIGRGAGRDTPNNSSLAGAIGHDASASGSLRFRIGGSGVVPEAGSSLQVISDKRDKVHVGDVSLDKARNIVLDARYVEYRMNPRESYEGFWSGDEHSIASHAEGKKQGKRVHAGVYAQDEAHRLSAQDIDFSGFQHAEIAGGRDSWSASYEAYIPYIGRIIQDQQARIEELERMISMLPIQGE